MAFKIRPGMMGASLIQEGDVLLDVPFINMTTRHDMATVIGTVLSVRKTSDGIPSWRVRTPGGGVIEHLADGSPNVLTYVHVPAGQL